ncbi:MAG: M1 family metallopeptidase [Chitinophagaceae bacterium]|jgi:hypothetical protein|nr:M1 family metallopeptidase [Chitinophagaceae bacterium]
MKKVLMSMLAMLPLLAIAQTGYWQQRVKYTMEVNVNAKANQFAGKQKLEYWNNSPDTLTKVYYHLYWNAFQPGSMMDVRSQRQGTIPGPRGADWDNRVKDRISKLNKEEIGYQKVVSLKMNGKPQSFIMLETILEVKLDKPILPKAKVVFDMEFEAQVPLQIRRSGRDNAEGVRFSMSQWYPKLCEYDKDGWHPNPYIAREFYGVWGDFEVKIAIDKSYVVGASGYLQNPNQVGYGYEAPGTKVTRPAGEKLLWHFIAPNVHDFVWAADPEYTHISKPVRDGMVLHAFYKIAPELLKKQYEALPAARKADYKNNPDNYVAFYKGQWEDVLEVAALALPFMDKTFGKYPYKQYSFIQGGDGGMEYPMATLLKGAGPDLIIHEWMHSWYQMMMGTNEALYAWMDEGFTSYAESRVMAYLEKDTGFAQAGNYRGYFALAKSNKEEPLTTHADHFNTNFAYTNAAYTKGSVFMEQLGYITGADVRDKILLAYYNQWRFKHPDVNDFMRVAEKTSGLQLDWYKEYWVNSTKTIDYAIDSLWEEGGKTKLRLSRVGLVPMPVDLQLTFKDGTKELHYIPLDLMYGEKPAEDLSIPRKVYDAWKWTHPVYIIETNRKLLDVTLAEIDPSQRMADVERKNNKLELKW